ncbi:MAG: hypothetical protein HFG75_07645 [Hungatella sp.]|nr:hypothetical protein [Hungatella sp.]
MKLWWSSGAGAGSAWQGSGLKIYNFLLFFFAPYGKIERTAYDRISQRKQQKGMDGK